MAENSDDVVLARIALLAMRAFLARRVPLSPEPRVLLEGFDEPVSHSVAAVSLARLPKPLACRATSRDGVLVARFKGAANTPWPLLKRHAFF